MVENALTAKPVLGGYAQQIGACALAERGDLALVSVATPLGGEAALHDKLASLWSLAPPTPTRSTVSGDMRAVPMTPDQMMLVFKAAPDLTEASVAADLKGVAYTTLQTDGWVVLELSGAGSLAALERMCPLDLDDKAFAVNASARTSMEHLGVTLLRLAEDRFLLMAARSSARSFLHTVETSCRWSAP